MCLPFSLGTRWPGTQHRGLLVVEWGILHPLGVVDQSACTALASAVVWSSGFGCLWLTLSSLSIVWCKQHRDAVRCHLLALSAYFLLRFALYAFGHVGSFVVLSVHLLKHSTVLKFELPVATL